MKKLKKERTLKNPVFKNQLTGLDFINSRPSVDKEKLILEVRLIPQGIIDPITTYEEIINLPINEFLALLLNFRLNQSKNIQHNDSRTSLIDKFRFKGDKGKKGQKTEFRFPEMEQQLPPNMPPMSIVTVLKEEKVGTEIKENNTIE